MDKIKQEKEYIMLLSIARYGYIAMPLDYAFLSRYSLIQIYFQILDGRASGLNTKPFEDAVKVHVGNLLSAVDLSELRAYKAAYGNKKTKELLGNNDFYWKVLLSELKKGKKQNKLDI